MNRRTLELGPASTDNPVDEQIAGYLDPENRRSFFLYAGAGSGKTRSLVTALTTFRERHGAAFRKSNKKIAVITYTNAACDEIIERVDEDPLFSVSTIHSFCWSQISSLHNDIRAWLQLVLPQEIRDLEQRQAKGRAGTQAAKDRQRSIAAKMKRLEWLSVPRRFTYDPNGDNYGRDSLGHTEVLKITSHFLQMKRAMQVLLVNQYPILLVDESQDTSKYLIEALLLLESAQRGAFALGLFGDTMQRIYPDGEAQLVQKVPADWAKPAKLMNHRSPRRIVALGNTLRASVDDHVQMARDDSENGVVRLFIVYANAGNKPAIEEQVRERMVKVTKDTNWALTGAAVKTLTLEHHMAAARMGFAALFDALDQDFSVGLRNGTLAGTRFFSEQVAPLIEASRRNDGFAVMAILRKHSPLLGRASIRQSPSAELLAITRAAVDALLAVDVNSDATTFMDVLQCVAKTGLFNVPESLKPFVTSDDSKFEPIAGPAQEDMGEQSPPGLSAWRKFLETPYCQIHPYAEYIADRGAFGTHQGVKGKEFDRVLVVMDDSGARGFMFSYEKLLGAKPLSEADLKKKELGEEIGVDRTRRLLYVTCTRARKSLALIAYTSEPEALAAAVIDNGWFERDELERL